MSVQIPYTAVDGTSLTAANFNGNFAALAARTVRNADIAPDAGIERTKLAQRFVPGHIFLPAISYTADADLGEAASTEDPANFTGLNTTWVEIARYKFRVPAGTEAFLCSAHLYNEEALFSPQVRLRVDTVTLGATEITLSGSNAEYEVIRGSDPFATPYTPIGNNSVFRVEVQGGATAEIRGLFVTLTTKMELIS